MHSIKIKRLPRNNLFRLSLKTKTFIYLANKKIKLHMFEYFFKLITQNAKIILKQNIVQTQQRLINYLHAILLW